MSDERHGETTPSFELASEHELICTTARSRVAPTTRPLRDRVPPPGMPMDSPGKKNIVDADSNTPCAAHETAIPTMHRGHFGWPALLTSEQLCDYLGIGLGTLAKICPVQPLDLGVRLVRYNRCNIDRWLESVPARMRESAANENIQLNTGDDRMSEALSRVKKHTRSGS